VPATVDPKYNLVDTPAISITILQYRRDFQRVGYWHAGKGFDEAGIFKVLSINHRWMTHEILARKGRPDGLRRNHNILGSGQNWRKALLAMGAHADSRVVPGLFDSRTQNHLSRRVSICAY